MRSANSNPWNHIILWFRLVFGVHLVYSGLAYVLVSWVPAATSDVTSNAGQFMVSLEHIGLYPFVKYLELIVGLMLVFDIAVPLALVAELPITIVIFFLNTIVEAKARQLFTGPQELFLNGALLFAYGGYFTNFLRLRAKPWWLWDNFPHRSVGPNAHGGPADSDVQSDHDMNGKSQTAWIVVATLSLTILAASWFLSPAERKLPPRDYVPLIVATLAMGWSMARARRRGAHS